MIQGVFCGKRIQKFCPSLLSPVYFMVKDNFLSKREAQVQEDVLLITTFMYEGQTEACENEGQVGCEKHLILSKIEFFIKRENCYQ